MLTKTKNQISFHRHFKRHPMNQFKDKTWAYFFSVVPAEGNNVLHCDVLFECHF